MIISCSIKPKSKIVDYRFRIDLSIERKKNVLS